MAEWIRCQKRCVTVDATFATSDGVLQTLEGPVTFRVGDALVRSAEGERWPVPREVFLRRYATGGAQAPGVDGPYVRRPELVRARRLVEPDSISINGGEITGSTGDWVLEDEGGSRWVVGKNQFERDYLIV